MNDVGRPTFDVNGLTSGHQGEGVKTIIPATAKAKLSFRLVPDQDPDEVTAAIEQHLENHCPTGVRWKLEADHGAPGMLAARTADLFTRQIVPLNLLSVSCLF